MRKGWRTTRLRDVCTIDKEQGIHKGLPYVGLEDIESNTARFVGSGAAQGVKSSTFRFSPKHVLYGRLRPYLNKVLAPDFDGHCSTEIFPIRPVAEVLREFLLYWFLAGATNERIDATATGARMPRADMNEVMEFDFPCPPRLEQERIVGILDEAFAGIAAAKAHTEQSRQQASEVFRSHLDHVFDAQGADRPRRPLADLCHSGRVITYGVIKLGDDVTDGIPCLRTSNVRWLRIEEKGMKRIAPSLSKEYARTILAGGEVLVSVRGTLGGVAVAEAKMAGWNVSREVAVVPIDPGKVSPRYIAYFVGSGIAQSWLSTVEKGAAYVGINIEDLRLLPVGLPTKGEQLRIVNALDSLFVETQRLESLYTRKLAALDELKKSLLHQAFSGAL